MKAIERIREYESQWGNLDFKTYNRASIACDMLESEDKQILDHINKYNYNLLLVDYLNIILNDDLLIHHYSLYEVLYFLNLYNSGEYELPLEEIRESILAVNSYGESKHKVVMRNNYITAPFEIYKEAYIRHYTYLKLGEKIDESGLPHLYHCWWNIVAMILIKLYKDNTIYYMLEKSND